MPSTASFSSHFALGAEQRPSGGGIGQSSGSSDCNSLSSTTRPQHLLLASSLEAGEVGPASETSHSEATSTAAPPGEGMRARKRGSACFSDPPAASATTSATTAADPEGPACLSIKPPPQGKKKRRVSFCKTTKPPSQDLQPQRPLNSLQQIMNHSFSCTALPTLDCSSVHSDLSGDASSVEVDLNVSPSMFVKTIVLQSKSLTGSMKGEDVLSQASRRVNCPSYFLTYTDVHLESYTVEKVNAVQSNDVNRLRLLRKEGHEMQASNRFGESMLHTSCRRGFHDVVDFFIREAGVSPRVRDDMGRTPMHDACWASCPPNHAIMTTLIRAAPELLLSIDKRGHSPFDYARREYWPQWVAFLHEHRGLVVESLVASCVEGDVDRLELDAGSIRSVEGLVNQ
ncbi:hypothetical protein ACHAXT_004380 [Thalassiosira profunda]